GAFGRIGPCKAAGAQLRPPSADTSTCRMLPLPDQACPEISWNPGPLSVSPGDGRVMTDFTSIGNTNCQAFSSLSRIVYFDVSSLVMAGLAVSLSRRSHFTFFETRQQQPHRIAVR